MTRNIKIEQPKMPRSLTSTAYMEIYDPEERYLNGVHIADCVIEGEQIERMEFSQVIFKNVVFQDVTFESIMCTDVIFENCDLSNANLMNANMHRTEFRDSKMLGINLAESYLKNILFVGCILNLGSFGYANLQQVRFENCVMRSADYYECIFKKVEFHACDIEEVNFSQTSLKGIDISNSTFERLSLGIEDLRGCIVSREQALGFATMLGLKIKE